MGYPRRMAKGTRNEASRAVLQEAWAAAERGDAVEARRLARAVLGGARGPDEDQAAKALAPRLSIEGAVVPATVEGVAQELLSRAGVPPRPYLFFFAVLATFVGLAVLAAARY